MTAHDKSTQDVLLDLATDKTQGLSEAEASARIAKYGENRLQEKKKKSTFQRFLDQFKDAMIIILLLAAAVSFTLIAIEGNWHEVFEPCLILLIVILNAVMGVYQEGKAEKALDALKICPHPTHASSVTAWSR